MITHPNVKINLGLNVLRKRPDGYHDLETLFVPYFGLTDTLEIITGDDYSRTIAGLQKEGVDWDPLKDLTAKAYMMLSDDFKLPPMKIFLEKTNPVGAGLGGGSADAAFALRMISELAELGLTDEALAGYAARLGSDCAFFIYNRPMMGSGRGEILEPFPLDLGDLKLEVVIPEGISVSTADAYRGIVPRIPAKPLAEVLRQDPSTWKEELRNDFEETVFAKYPKLAAIKAELYEKGALYCAMSGSGSSLYTLFRP